jgi:cleavage and polyadenylation specificity factor subunit 1
MTQVCIQLFNHVLEFEAYYETVDLGLTQIIPMIDEETDKELNVKFSQFCDPYLLVIRDDLSAMVIKVDERGELEDLDRGEAIISCEWISGCIQRPASEENHLAYLLNSRGSVTVILTQLRRQQ